MSEPSNCHCNPAPCTTLSEGKRSHEREHEEHEEHAPQSLTLTTGTALAPRNFVFSAPSRRFASELNRLMMVLPDLLERISPEEAEVYAGEQNVRQTAVSTTATESDYLILCDCSAGGIIVSLFSATKSGRTLVIVKVDSTANAVTPFGNDTIEGDPSKTLASQYDKAILTANGVSTWLDEGTGEI